jgi:Histidine kinase
VEVVSTNSPSNVAKLVSAERHRIARDLHDSVAQSLIGIGLHLEWCQRHTDPDAPGYERLVASKELARAGRPIGMVPEGTLLHLSCRYGQVTGMERP